MLLAERSIYTPTGDAVLFRRLESDQGFVSTIVSELHALVGGRYVILLAESFPPSAEGHDARYTRYKLADPIVAENHLDMVARHMRRAADPEHAGPGFCLNGVLFNQRDSGVDEEKATFDFVTNGDEQPKLSFEVAMNGKHGFSKETLHKRMSRRMAAVRPYPEQALAREFRRSKSVRSGMPFQEWGGELYTVRSRSTEYSFLAQSSEAEDAERRFEHPAMSITMTSGGNTADSASPYSLEQLEKAWDQWLTTLRLSPGNGGPRR